MFMPDHPTARALLAFRAAHGRRWKAKLLFLWSIGRDVEEADGACLRQLRNQAAQAWLRRLSPRRWRAIERLAEPGDWQTASIFLDRAREFHEGARFGATVALAPALHLLAICCELGLKAYLMSRGWSHEEVARDIRHDLIAAFDEARRLGLPSPGPYSRRFAYKPRSRLCRASYRRAGGGWLCLRFRGYGPFRRAAWAAGGAKSSLRFAKALDRRGPIGRGCP